MRLTPVGAALSLILMSAGIGSGAALAFGGSAELPTRTATTCPPNPDGSHPPCPPPEVPVETTLPVCDGIVDGVFTSVPCGEQQPPPPSPPADPLIAPAGFNPRFTG